METNIVNGIYQDFELSQRPANLRPCDIEAIGAMPEIQGFIDELQETYSKCPEENYGFDKPLGVINSPRDEGIRKIVKAVADDVKRSVCDIKYVIHCGIGGSELGATMLISALGTEAREFIPITSLNNDYVKKALERIEPEKTVLVKSTRSNKTKETLVAFDVFASELEKKLGEKHRSHCVAIIGKDKEGEARDRSYHFVPIEGEMSGRYTGLHAANIFTMYLMGVDIDALHEGAENMLRKCVLNRDVERNPALEMAAYVYFMTTQCGKHVLNTGVFSPYLLKYGDWLGQLVEESLCHGSLGMTTKTSELSNKAHSYYQGWIESGDSTYHQFVFPVGEKEEAVCNPGKKDETLGDIEFAAYIGISKSLADAGRPSYTTFMKSLNEGAFGELMMRDMIATMMLGELYGLRREYISGKATDFGYFNQPGVTKYKMISESELGNLSALKEKRSRAERIFGLR